MKGAKKNDADVKAFLDEIKIEKNIVLLDAAKIKPYERNAKKHTTEQITAVANSIRRFGFNVPLIIDAKNVIIAGHCRYEASKELGIVQIPCILKPNLTKKEIQAYRVADNKLNESIWDNPLLYNEMADLNDPDLIRLAGFDPDDIGRIADPVDRVSNSSNSEYNDNVYKYEIIFDNAEDFAKFGRCVAEITIEAGGAPISKSLLKFLEKNVTIKNRE